MLKLTTAKHCMSLTKFCELLDSQGRGGGGGGGG